MTRVVIRDRTLELNGRERPLGPDVQAVVEVSGGVVDAPPRKRPGLGAAVLTPKLAAVRLASSALRPRQYDTRAVYLSVQGPDWFELVEYRADEGPAARADAQAINAAAAAWR